MYALGLGLRLLPALLGERILTGRLGLIVLTGSLPELPSLLGLPSLTGLPGLPELGLRRPGLPGVIRNTNRLEEAAEDGTSPPAAFPGFLLMDGALPMLMVPDGTHVHRPLLRIGVILILQG